MTETLLTDRIDIPTYKTALDTAILTILRNMGDQTPEDLFDNLQVAPTIAPLLLTDFLREMRILANRGQVIIPTVGVYGIPQSRE